MMISTDNVKVLTQLIAEHCGKTPQNDREKAKLFADMKMVEAIFKRPITRNMGIFNEQK